MLIRGARRIRRTPCPVFDYRSHEYFGSTSAPIDEYWDKVGSLLEFDGANNGTVFTDDKGGVWTGEGGAVTSTTIHPVGTASLLLNGSTDRISTPVNPARNILSGGAFTLEAYITLAGTPNATYGAVIASQDAATAGWLWRVYTAKLSFVFPGVIAYDFPGTYSVGQTYHVVVQRTAAGVMEVWRDGVKSATTHSGAGGLTTDHTGTNLKIGSSSNAVGPGWFPGNIDHFRLTKGVARYSADFTPPTTLYPTASTPAPYSTSLALWLDASDSSTITLSGSEVSDWRCKVTGTVWSQATAANRPTIDTSRASVLQNAIGFTSGGTTRFLSGNAISLPYPMTAFIASVRPRTGTYQALGIQDGVATNVHSAGGNFALFGWGTNSSIQRSMQAYSAGDYSYLNGNFGASGNEGEVLCFSIPTIAAADTVLERNNASVVESFSAGSYSSTPQVSAVGSSDTLYKSYGTLCEVLVYTTTLNATARGEVAAYLNSKWGLY